LQKAFFALRDNGEAFVTSGSGSLANGTIEIQVDNPSSALHILKVLFHGGKTHYEGNYVVLLPHVHIALFDEQDQLWRTFHPLTPRPFWTLLKPAHIIEGIMALGRSTANA